jgi:hypothetical protein
LIRSPESPSPHGTSARPTASCTASPPTADPADPLHSCHNRHQQQVQVLLPPGPIAPGPGPRMISGPLPSGANYLYSLLRARTGRARPARRALSSRPTMPTYCSRIAGSCLVSASVLRL